MKLKNQTSFFIFFLNRVKQPPSLQSAVSIWHCCRAASLKIILTCSPNQFPSSHFSSPSHVALPHIIRWSGSFDKRILTCTASWAALQPRRTVNNDCGVVSTMLTRVSTRAALCWQSSGLLPAARACVCSCGPDVWAQRLLKGQRGRTVSRSLT